MTEAMEHTPVPLPPNLAPFADDVERYVEARIRQFAGFFAKHNPDGVASEDVDVLVTKALEELRATTDPNEQATVPAAAARQAQAHMVFTHTCRSTGCGDMDCLLCKHNPERRCTRHVKHKYLVEDRLRAACGAPVFIDLRTDSGALADIPCHIQLQLLDGQKYDEMAKQMPIPPALSDAEACLIPPPKGLKWVKGPDVKPGSEDEHKVVLPVEGGRVNLEDVMIMVSSEAILTGYRPNFRLLAVAIGADGTPVRSVPFCLSDPFVATTRRVKNTVKVEIPLVNDDISKLVHMGRATVDKMNNLVDAGRGMNIQLSLPADLVKVNTVGAFQKLVEACEKDRTLKGKVMQVLKLNHDKWEEAAKHARDAVEPDFRQRVWLHRAKNVGIVFKCRRGAVQLEQPEGLVRLEADGSYSHANITAISQVHDPRTLQMTQQLRLEAAEAWAQPRHPGWGICAAKDDPHPHASAMDDMEGRLGSGGMDLAPPAGAHLSAGRPYDHSSMPPGAGWANPASSPFELSSLGHSTGTTITTQNGAAKDPRSQFGQLPHHHRNPITTTISPHSISAFTQAPTASATPAVPSPNPNAAAATLPNPGRPIPTTAIPATPWRDPNTPYSPFESRPASPPKSVPPVLPLFHSNPQASANAAAPQNGRKRAAQGAPEGEQRADKQTRSSPPPAEPLPNLPTIESLPDGTPPLVQLMQSVSAPMGDAPPNLPPASEALSIATSSGSLPSDQPPPSAPQAQQQLHALQNILPSIQHLGPVMVLAPAAWPQQGPVDPQKGATQMMVLAPGPLTYLTSTSSASLTAAAGGLDAATFSELGSLMMPAGTPSLMYSHIPELANLSSHQLPSFEAADLLARLPHSAAMQLQAAPVPATTAAERGGAQQ